MALFVSDDDTESPNVCSTSLLFIVYTIIKTLYFPTTCLFDVVASLCSLVSCAGLPGHCFDWFVLKMFVPTSFLSILKSSLRSPENIPKHVWEQLRNECCDKKRKWVREINVCRRYKLHFPGRHPETMKYNVIFKIARCQPVAYRNQLHFSDLSVVFLFREMKIHP